MSENVTVKAIDAYEYIFGKLSLGSFSSRLMFQKTIYLLKLFGVPSFQDLSYTWYKRGPYCFELGGIYSKKYQEKYYLDEKDVESIKNCKKIILELISDEKYGELNSSIAYLLHDEKLSDEDIIKRMFLTKPWFEKANVESALVK